MTSISATHYFTHFRGLGGVQSILKQHVAQDAAWGLASRVVAFFEPEKLPEAAVTGLGLDWRSTIREARRRFAALPREPRPAEVAIYLNLWGLCFFADLDQSARRVGVLHSDWPGLAEQLPAYDGLLDGLLCVSEPLRALACRQLPALDPARVLTFQCPIVSPPPQVPHPDVRARPLVVGFNGRVSKQQKRVDRLPALVRHLEDAGVAFRLEILGDGPELNWLRRRLSSRTDVRFHGRLSGDDYWRALGTWDAILFVSDYEGLPLSMLEAMSLGVIPVFPNIDSGGDAYAAAIDADFLYPKSELCAAAAQLQRISQAPGADVNEWRRRCRDVVQPHLNDSYHRDFSAFLRRISEAPRVSTAVFPKRPFFLTDSCPLALLRRVAPNGFHRRAGH